MTTFETHSAAASEAPEAADIRPVVLSTHGLTKDFKKLRAVDGLDLVVRRGDVFGFLGPNGAGKSTTIRLIFGLIYPSAGHVEVLGNKVPRDRQAALRHVGGFVDDPMFYGNVSARRNLRLFGSMGGRVTDKRISEVLELVGLSDRARSKVGTYSHGMKQRLGIALALMHKPQLVILDEPTSGLDPQGMRDVRELIRELGRQGTTIFLSSHLLHEVEQVCDQAAIVNGGRLVIQGPVSQLRPAANRIKLRTSDQLRAASVLRDVVPAERMSDEEGHLVVKTEPEMVPEIVRVLVAQGIDVHEVVPAHEQSLEEVFLQLTSSAGSDNQEPRV